jgi:DNA-binding transcriptional MerR regulator
MSTNQKLLSIEDSARVTGVSKDTIAQYRDLGLLRAVNERENSPLFAEDIQEVFGIPEIEFEHQAVEVNNCSVLNKAHITLAPHSEPSSVPSKSRSSFMGRKLSRQKRVKELESDLHSLRARCRALESRLKMVNEERDWLRSRVERLEVRSEREQMLLLAQQQQTQNLLAARDSRRSFWQFALPWLNGK